MGKAKRNFSKIAAFLMSFMLVFSMFTGLNLVNTYAVSYSEMSALDQYAYGGDDLGATYTKSATTFKVWSPTASKVQIKRYKTGSDSEAGAGVIETKDMTKQSQGIWSITISGDLAGTYYTYLVTNNGVTKEAVDIYARSTGVNGMRGMVVDLDATNPAGWNLDQRVDCDNQTDAIIWEGHVRDFSASSDSGMTNKGKYLAFTETGTTVNNDGVHKTGVDYLEDLGITHIHLLPVYDYGSVDETKLNTDQFNWGYDPMNYNTPEGSYSTNPYDGAVRVNEFKQMVKSLHDKNIGVVMDVVYNHTYAGDSGINDWFDYTVPGYYYRQKANGKLSNASGCGNETASDRAMYQKYMIDSITYWAKEYHIDGFRFDLMGIHDVDTMNKIRAALDEIDPDILMYGEPWTAEATTSTKPTAVQSNMKLVSSEIAAFNDKVRDAIKGSCFNAADPGFIQGAAGFETSLKAGIQANSTSMGGTANQWSKQPSQTVTYTSAHDNYTLYDKLVKSVKGGSGYGNRYDDLVAMNKMAGGIILTSQGMSFFQAGEEFARSKYGDENSYKSATNINQLKWQNTITYADVNAYYKGLIEIRKAYSPFRDPSNTSNGTIYFSWGTNCPDKVVAFTMYNKLKTDEWDYVAVIHNANTYSQRVTLQTYDNKTLPSQWVIIADGQTAGVTSLGTSGSTVNVPARSTMVLVDKTSFENTDISKKCTVTVNHIKDGSTATYKTETLKGDEGKAYTTQPLAELLNSGYKLKSTVGQTAGTFSKAGATVTYYYEKDASKVGSVVVKYVDASGNEIAASEMNEGLIGTSYTFAPKTIKGYETNEGPVTGTYAKETRTITFKYLEKQSTGITVHYYNSSNWSKVAMYAYTEVGSKATQYTGAWPGTLMTSEGDNWYVGDIDYDGTLYFIANNNGGGAQDPTGVGTKGYEVSDEVWIKNGKIYKAGKVNVTYVAEDGTVLATTTLSGLADGSNTYSTSAKNFDGYKLKTAPSNASGVYTEGTISVEYVYEKDIVVEPLKVSLSAAKTTITSGDRDTLTAVATGGSGSYVYTYSITVGDKTVVMAKDIKSNKYDWASGAAGTKTLNVTATDSEGQTAKASISIVVNAKQTSNLKVTLKAKSTIVMPNEIDKLSAEATGGAGGYKYTYKISVGTATKTLATNQTSKDFYWNSGKVGNKTLTVIVTDSKGNKVSASTKVEVTDKKLSVVIFAKYANVASNTIDRLEAKTAGGTGLCTYTFVVKSGDKSFTLADRQYGSLFYWNSSKPGKKTLIVTVRDQAGAVATSSMDITVK